MSVLVSAPCRETGSAASRRAPYNSDFRLKNQRINLYGLGRNKRLIKNDQEQINSIFLMNKGPIGRL